VDEQPPEAVQESAASEAIHAEKGGMIVEEKRREGVVHDVLHPASGSAMLRLISRQVNMTHYE
jgi:hypothetical protein